jgi:uncharacterized protein
MMTNTPSDKDLDFIDDMFEKYGNEHAMLNVSELDGFLAAIVSGPDTITPSEWLPVVWGGEEAMPKWESETELQRFIGISFALMNLHAQTLMEAPEDFAALFLVSDDNGKEVRIVTPWCVGYMTGVSLRLAQWDAMPDAIMEQLAHIALFGSIDDDDSLFELSANSTEHLQEKVEPAARAIHAYWLAQRKHLTPSHDTSARSPRANVIPFVRPQPKIGPNAACPCGSGKKYKKCCGLQL